MYLYQPTLHSKKIPLQSLYITGCTRRNITWSKKNETIQNCLFKIPISKPNYIRRGKPEKGLEEIIRNG
ncbi:hypothetical protein AAY473_039438 [Plecturocebus cupreus]